MIPTSKQDLDRAIDQKVEQQLAYHPIHRGRWQALTVWIVIFSAFTFFLLYEVRGQARENATARKGLCYLRRDVERRVDEQRSFLKRHPNGAFGFSKQDIQRSIKNSERSITALMAVKCSDIKGE